MAELVLKDRDHAALGHQHATELLLKSGFTALEVVVEVCQDGGATPTNDGIVGVKQDVLQIP
jgi:hypothetical protein